MTRLQHAEGYEPWKESLYAFYRAAAERHARIGPQSLNAARAETLRHVRDTRARISGAEAQKVWSAAASCSWCGDSIQPGDPYVDHMVGTDPVSVLVCCECEFRPSVVRLFSTPSSAALPDVSFAEAIDAALRALDERRRARWMRQDKLKHRGMVWRLRRWVNWCSMNSWILELAPLPRLHRAALRKAGWWQMRRLLAQAQRPHPRWQRAAEDLTGRYASGRRRFVRAELAHAKLRGANLAGANLSMADLNGVELSDANLSEALLVRADLEKANLYAADLRHADLEGANLFAACLANANLEQANLSRVELSGVNLYEASVTDEQLAEAASLKGALLPDGTVQE